MTSAMLAAKQGREDQLKVLDDYLSGNPVHFKSHQGQNRDFEAVYDPSVYSRERSPTKIEFNSDAVFLDAAANIDSETVAKMLSDKSVDANVTNADGLTALHQACIENSLKVVSLLLLNEADVNATDNDWWTPLHAAAACDHWRVVNKLLESGADVTMVNADGDLAVDLAEDGKTKDVLATEMDRLAMDGAAIEELKSWSRLEEKFVEDVEKLVAESTHLDYRGPNYESLLHIAASNGWTNAAKLLIDNGSPLAPIDENGDTPLHLAAFFEQYKMVELLGESGAKVSALNRFKDSVLMMTEDATMIRLLKAIQSNQKQKGITGSMNRNGRSGSSVKRMSMADKQRLKNKDTEEEKATTTQYAELQFDGDHDNETPKRERPESAGVQYTDVQGSGDGPAAHSPKKNSKKDKKSSSVDYDQAGIQENPTYDHAKGSPAGATPNLYAVSKSKRESVAQDEHVKKGGGCCTIS